MSTQLCCKAPYSCDDKVLCAINDMKVYSLETPPRNPPQMTNDLFTLCRTFVFLSDVTSAAFVASWSNAHPPPFPYTNVCRCLCCNLEFLDQSHADRTFLMITFCMCAAPLSRSAVSLLVPKRVIHAATVHGTPDYQENKHNSNHFFLFKFPYPAHMTSIWSYEILHLAPVKSMTAQVVETDGYLFLTI